VSPSPATKKTKERRRERNCFFWQKRKKKGGGQLIPVQRPLKYERGRKKT